MKSSSDALLPVGKITSTHGIKGEVKVYPFVDDPDRFSDYKRVFVAAGNGGGERRAERQSYKTQSDKERSYKTQSDKERSYKGQPDKGRLTGDQSLMELEIERVRFHKGMVIVKFKEFGDINEVLPYKGRELLMRREEILTLNEWQFFDVDLVGLSIFLEDGSLLGTLTQVIHTGANDVYECRKAGKGSVSGSGSAGGNGSGGNGSESAGGGDGSVGSGSVSGGGNGSGGGGDGKGRSILIPAIRECVLEVDIEGGRMVVRLLPGLDEE